MSDEEETAAPPADAPETRAVEYDRYQRVVRAKQGLESQLEEARAELAALTEKAATVDMLSQQVQEWQGKAQAEGQRFERYQSISSAIGTTDPGAIEAFEWQYGKAGEEAPPLNEWLDGLKSNPETAPLVLRPFFAAEEAPTRAPAPKAPKASAAPPDGTDPYSEKMIGELGKKARETGDWTAYNEAMERGGWR